MNDDTPWWDTEDPRDLLMATVDELRATDETRRVCLRILDDLYDGRTLYAAANAPAVQAVGRSGLQAHMLNFARNAVDFVHSKVGADVPAVRASGHGADSSQRRRARLLTKFIAGAACELRIPAALIRGLLTALRLGTGATKVTTVDGRIHVEAVSPRDLLVDADDAIRGEPRVLYHVSRTDRRALMARYPDAADALRSTQVSSDTVDVRFDPWLMGNQSSDAVDLVDVTVLPSGDGPGRHIICVRNATLLDADWDCPRHQVALMPMSDAVEGPWGHGLLERLDACQFEIDDLISHIGRSIRENNLKIIVDDAGDAPLEAITDPTIGTVIRVRNGATPKWVTPQAVSPQDMDWLRQLIGWLYQVAGMDEGAASQQAPSQLSSGRALQFYHDFQSLRYVDLSKRLGAHAVAVTERVLDRARILAADPDADWSVRYSRGSETRTIRWAEVDMEADAYVIELEEASAFPDTLAGRMQQVEQDAAEGRVPSDVLAQLRLDPDLEARWDRMSADADFVDWVVEQLTDPTAEMPPQPDEMPVQDVIDAIRAEVLRSIVGGEDPAVTERLQTYLADVIASGQPQQTSQPVGPGVPGVPAPEASQPAAPEAPGAPT